MPRVVHFEISATNTDRAAAFYTAVFGWQFHKWEGPEPYWLIKTGEPDEPGIDGGLFERKEDERHINTIGVDSVDTYVAKITAQGGSVAVPKMSIPGVGYMAYCLDTEGSMFGIMEMDETAT